MRERDGAWLAPVVILYLREALGPEVRGDGENVTFFNAQGWDLIGRRCGKFTFIFVVV